MAVEIKLGSRGYNITYVLIEILILMYLIDYVEVLDTDATTKLIISAIIVSVLNEVYFKIKKKMRKRKKAKFKNKVNTKNRFRVKAEDIGALLLISLYIVYRTELAPTWEADLIVGSTFLLYFISRTKLLSMVFKKHNFKSQRMASIDKMSGVKFEEYVEYIFKKSGYKVIRTQESGDFGADLIIRKYGKKTVVQVKRYSSNVGLSAVQEVVSAKKYYRCSTAIVVTNSYFTKAAIELAKANNVKLYNRQWLEGMVSSK